MKYLWIFAAVLMGWLSVQAVGHGHTEAAVVDLIFAVVFLSVALAVRETEVD